VQAGEHSDDVTLDLYVAGDVGATDAELARGPKDAPQRVRGADTKGADTVVGSYGAPVPQLEANRDPVAQEVAHQWRKSSGRARTCGKSTDGM